MQSVVFRFGPDRLNPPLAGPWLPRLAKRTSSRGFSRNILRVLLTDVLGGMADFLIEDHVGQIFDQGPHQVKVKLRRGRMFDSGLSSNLVDSGINQAATFWMRSS
jgi:hypothetical protein